jgi:hypothetical protein
MDDTALARLELCLARQLESPKCGGLSDPVAICSSWTTKSCVPLYSMRDSCFVRLSGRLQIMRSRPIRTGVTMKLSTVYARFYKSFNFDHLRKASRTAEPKGEWEMFRGAWYPYVEVQLDSRITTIVGANESGKSHLLTAIEKAVSGTGFEQRDLCRYANALVEAVNDQLERYLNFKKWWVQDRDFSLRVTPREHELVFTIRDRTGTEYTFDERSSGLKFFLSYLIQAQSHRPQTDRKSILLMDEPDTYLASDKIL